MSIEKITGGYLIADIKNGYRVKQRYFGFTKKEAIKLFKQYLKTL